MKNIKKIVFAALLLSAFCREATAQIEFKIQHLSNSEYYTISAVSDADYPVPNNMISTAQVTIKVPTGGFEVGEIQNLYNTGHWRVNGRCNAPTIRSASSNFDYIYFGLENIGSTAFPFKKGQETVLFAFKAAGVCTGEVSLMDNQSDEFRSPNAMRINVGNQITILGKGGDAYVGNRSDGQIADCFERTLTDKATDGIVIMPNPVAGNTFTFALTNPNLTAMAADVWLYDMAGRAVFFQKINFEAGFNQKEVSIETFPIGVYQLAVFGLTKETMHQTVVKGD
jgi:hypothetical protein